VSLAAQQAKLEAYALVKSWPLVKIVRDEGASAKSLKRPGLQRLLGLVKAGQVDVVMIAKLDRLSRRVRDVHELVDLFEQRGVALVSLQESLDATMTTGRAMIGLLAVMSQLERELIAERTRDALQHLKATGRRYCYSVYGDAAVIDRMHQLRAAGATYAPIAAHLNDAGVPTALGRRWRPMSVWVILKRTQPKRQRRGA
jgi:site-specific DNA recombinase